MIDLGTLAPGFTLPSDTGGDVTLADFRGKKVILYFYPKDNTPGCTVQACDFRDSLPGFEGAGVVVLGVSADSIESHRMFRKLFSLNFPLLADQDHTVSRAYGVWKKHKVFGMNIERSTFLIDEAGNIERIWRNVRPGGHTKMLSGLVDGGLSNRTRSDNPMSKWMKVLAFTGLFCTVIAIGIAIYASITASLGVEAGPQNYLDAWLTSAMLVSIDMMYIDYWKSFFKKS